MEGECSHQFCLFHFGVWSSECVNLGLVVFKKNKNKNKKRRLWHHVLIILRGLDEANHCRYNTFIETLLFE